MKLRQRADRGGPEGSAEAQLFKARCNGTRRWRGHSAGIGAASAAGGCWPGGDAGGFDALGGGPPVAPISARGCRCHAPCRAVFAAQTLQWAAHRYGGMNCWARPCGRGAQLERDRGRAAVLILVADLDQDAGRRAAAQRARALTLLRRRCLRAAGAEPLSRLLKAVTPAC